MLIVAKCDERTPICSACDRLDLTCDYASMRKKRSSTPLTPSTPASQLGQDDSWSRLDLELLHHFTTCCCTSIPGEDNKRVWTHDLVQVAFSKDFLLLQILAVSALHLYQKRPTRTDLATKASFYRGRALQLIQPVMANLDATVCIPVFAFAGLTMIHGFAELPVRIDTDGETYDPVRHVSECLQLNFGIHTVVYSYWQDIEDSWAGGLLDFNSEEEFKRLEISGQTFAHAGEAYAMIDQVDLESPYRIACHEALDIILRTTQILLWRDDEDGIFHLVHAWPGRIKAEFWQMAEQDNPAFLLVMAHFAALMCLRPVLWWFKRWPEVLLDAIDRKMEERWKPALAWPKRMVQAHKAKW